MHTFRFFRPRFLSTLTTLCLAAFLVACDRSGTSKADAPFALPEIRLDIGSKKVSVEIADTPQTMARGLMFRDSLPENSGMLFVYPTAQQASFYMKNTRIPLSIAYILRDGEIAEIHDMQPFDLTPVTSRSAEIYYALEMNQGWFSSNAIKPGTKISGLPKGPK